MINPVIAQGVGVAALILAVTIYQVNDRKKMLLIGTCTCFLWSVHFFMLGAFTGSLMNLIGTVRAATFYNVIPGKQNIWILWLFLALLTLASIITWQGAISLLPLTGSAINIIAYWQKKPRIIRRLALGTPPPWFTYNVISGSYPGMAVEILKMTSNLIGIYRFDRKGQKSDARLLKTQKLT